MGRMPKCFSSFFKVLIGDFADKLRIPPAFMKKNLIEKLPENLTLETHTGESWVVKLEQTGGYHYFMHCGWQKFVKNHKLEVGDFLVFCPISDSTFKVVMYDRSGCEKELITAIGSNIGDGSPTSEQKTENPLLGSRRRDAHVKRSRANLRVKIERDKSADAYVKRSTALHVKIERDESEGIVEAAGSVKEIQPSFIAVLNKYNNYVMNLPLGYARETGLITQKSTVLRDPEGRLWPVAIRLRKHGKVELGNGWSRFRRANKLACADTCLFRFMQSDEDVIQVQILERGKKVPCKRCHLLS